MTTTDVFTSAEDGHAVAVGVADATASLIMADGSLAVADVAAISSPALAAFNNLSADIRHQILQFYSDTRAFERKVGIIIPSIFTIVIVVGLVGNLLVIVVALNRQMRNSTNTLIIGLTCSDLMFLTLCVPFTAIDYAFPIWVLPTWTCNAINYLQHSSAYFSVWTLTLMAADRFLAVCYPVESMTLRSSRNTCIALCVTYGIIMLSQIQVGRIHDVYNYTFVIEHRSACSIVSIAKGEATVSEARLYFFSFNIFGYVIPLGITCIFYYFMLKRLWYTPKPGGLTAANNASASSNNNNNSSGNHYYHHASASSNSAFHATSRSVSGGSIKTNVTKLSSSSLRCRPETVRAKRKVTRLVMCVVVIWALCWLPLNICFFISGLIYPDTLVLKGGKPIIIIQISSQVLAYTNSCLNPILYPLVSDNFRKGFLRIISLILNWCTFGRYCRGGRRNFRLNSRMEVTFYNNDGSRSRSSTNNNNNTAASNSNRMSRTNSYASHRHNTNSTTTTNTHGVGESSSLLIRSSYSSRGGGSATSATLLASGVASVSAAAPALVNASKRPSIRHYHRNSRTEMSTVSLPLLENTPPTTTNTITTTTTITNTMYATALRSPTTRHAETPFSATVVAATAVVATREEEVERRVRITLRHDERDTIDEDDDDNNFSDSDDEPAAKLVTGAAAAVAVVVVQPDGEGGGGGEEDSDSSN